jgi:hypothetical protein
MVDWRTWHALATCEEDQENTQVFMVSLYEFLWQPDA